jgi:transposase
MRICICGTPTDMRKGFDGLYALVREVFQRDLDGHLFLFVNRRSDRLKILWWDRDGLAYFYKRLESGTYQLPAVAKDCRSAEIDATDFAMLLNGIDLSSAKRRKRYLRPV